MNDFGGRGDDFVDGDSDVNDGGGEGDGDDNSSDLWTTNWSIQTIMYDEEEEREDVTVVGIMMVKGMMMSP